MNDNDNVVDLMSRKPVTPPAPQAIEYEVHFYPGIDGEPGGVEMTKGFLKFGPQFIAVLDGPNDSDPVVFTVATAAVQFIKRVDSEGTVQGTLSL